jgi:hypothetical protein
MSGAVGVSRKARTGGRPTDLAWKNKRRVTMSDPPLSM